MRSIALSLLAVPALVSALTTPVRRSNTGFATFYYTQTGNAGSCGQYLSDTDYTVAVNSGQYSGDMCGKTINIHANGKTTQAKVMDECPEGGGNCHWGDLDLSPSLFQFFNDLGAGKFAIEWEFTDEAAPAPAPAPTTTYAADPIPSPPAASSPPVDTPAVPTVDTPPVEYVPPTTTTSDVVVQPTTTTPVDLYVQSETTTSTTSSETTTSTPSLGEQLAQAMDGHDIYGLGQALANLGNAMMYPTSTPSPTPA